MNILTGGKYTTFHVTYKCNLKELHNHKNENDKMA